MSVPFCSVLKRENRWNLRIKFLNINCCIYFSIWKCIKSDFLKYDFHWNPQACTYAVRFMRIPLLLNRCCNCSVKHRWVRELIYYYTLTDAQEITFGHYHFAWMCACISVALDSQDWILCLRSLKQNACFIYPVPCGSQFMGQFKHDTRIKKEITCCPWTSNCSAENKT